MANFLDEVGVGLSSTLPGIGAIISGNINRQAEMDFYGNREKYEQSQREALAERKEQAGREQKAFELYQKIDALDKILKGGETKSEIVNRYSNDTIMNPSAPMVPTMETRTKFQPYDKSTLASLMISAGSTPNEILNRLEPKKEYTHFVQKPKKTMGFNKATNQYETIQEYEDKNPAYEPKYIEKIIDENGKYDPKTGKMRFEYGRYDPETGEWQNDEKGKPIITRPQYVAITEKSRNGEDVYSKKINAWLDKDFEVINELSAAYTSAISGQTPRKANGEPYFDVDENGGKVGVASANSIGKRLYGISAQYVEKVKNLSSSNFTNWYDALYNAEGGNKKRGTNPSPADYWNNLVGSYKKGDLSDMDFQSGRRIFQGTYYFDPFLKYGLQADGEE